MVLSSLAVNQGISDITEEHIIAWANRKVSSHHFISLYNYNAVLEYEVHIITNKLTIIIFRFCRSYLPFFLRPPIISLGGIIWENIHHEKFPRSRARQWIILSGSGCGDRTQSCKLGAGDDGWNTGGQDLQR